MAGAYCIIVRECNLGYKYTYFQNNNAGVFAGRGIELFSVGRSMLGFLAGFSFL